MTYLEMLASHIALKEYARLWLCPDPKQAVVPLQACLVTVTKGLVPQLRFLFFDCSTAPADIITWLFSYLLMASEQHILKMLNMKQLNELER